MIIKEQVNLAEGPILGFWEPKPAPDITKEVGRSIEKSGFSTPAPS
jgi:hypothetical protein